MAAQRQHDVKSAAGESRHRGTRAVPPEFPLAALETALRNCGFKAGVDAALAVYRKARK